MVSRMCFHRCTVLVLLLSWMTIASASLWDPPRSECGTDVWRARFADGQRDSVAKIDSVVAWVRHQPAPPPDVVCRLPGLADELRERGIRLVIWQCRARDDCGGLGDRQRGIVSTVALGLCTGRGFFLDWPLSEHVWEGADGIPTRVPDETWALLGIAPPDGAGLPLCDLASVVRHHNFINRRDPHSLINVMEEDANRPIVIIQSNTNSLRLMQRHVPAWQQWVATARIPEHRLWGCLLRLLMQPAPAVVQHYHTFLSRLQVSSSSAPTPLVLADHPAFIGIHIRTGTFDHCCISFR